MPPSGALPRLVIAAALAVLAAVWLHRSRRYEGWRSASAAAQVVPQAVAVPGMVLTPAPSDRRGPNASSVLRRAAGPPVSVAAGPPKPVGSDDVANGTRTHSGSPRSLRLDITLALAAGWKDNATLLNYTLGTWEANGLLALTAEHLAVINPPTDDSLRRPKDWARLARITDVAKRYNFTVLPVARPQLVGRVMHLLVANASRGMVLFLEKDFLLIESPAEARRQLVRGVRLIQAGTAQVVRYRSRFRPGFPNFQDIVYRGKEQKYDANNSTMGNVCNAFYWLHFDGQQCILAKKMKCVHAFMFIV
eukprot:EG_transcript_11480